MTEQNGGPKHLGNRWYKGMPSANPKGRPRTGLAFSEMARDKDNMEARFAVVLAMALGQPVLRAYDADGNPIVSTYDPKKTARAEVVWVSPEVVLRANEFINAWAYQKPPAQVELTTKEDPSGLDWSNLDDAKRMQAIELFGLAAGALAARSDPALQETIVAASPEPSEPATEQPALEPATRPNDEP